MERHDSKLGSGLVISDRERHHLIWPSESPVIWPPQRARCWQVT